jgi:hypothetical protein
MLYYGNSLDQAAMSNVHIGRKLDSLRVRQGELKGLRAPCSAIHGDEQGCHGASPQQITSGTGYDSMHKLSCPMDWSWRGACHCRRVSSLAHLHAPRMLQNSQ